MASSSRRRPVPARGNRSGNLGPGRAAPTGGIASGAAPTAAPQTVLGAWLANGGAAPGMPAPAPGPWETAAGVRLDGHPAPGEDAVLQDVGELVDQLPPEERERLQAWARQYEQTGQAPGWGDPLEALADLEMPAFDAEAMFGAPDPQGTAPAGESDYAAPTTRGASTGSSPLDGLDPLQARGRAKAFAQLAAAAFAVVSGLLNARLRLDEDDETWLADREDLKTIGDPAGRMIARHAPLPGGTDATDLADGIGIGVGVAGYLIKNVRARAAELRARRRATASGV